MRWWTVFLQILVAGLISGSIYAFIALGYNLIYNVSGVVNLAQGEFFTYGAFFMLLFSSNLCLPFWLAFPFTILSVMIIGLIVEKMVIRREIIFSSIMAICITLGVSSFSRGITLLAFGSNPYKAPPFPKESFPFSMSPSIHR